MENNGFTKMPPQSPHLKANEGRHSVHADVSSKKEKMKRMKINYILLFGGLCVLVLSLLWYFRIVEEPLVAIFSAVLTILGFLFVPSEKKSEIKEEVVDNSNSAKDESQTGVTQIGEKNIYIGNDYHGNLKL